MVMLKRLWKVGRSSFSALGKRCEKERCNNRSGERAIEGGRNGDEQRRGCEEEEVAVDRDFLFW